MRVAVRLFATLSGFLPGGPRREETVLEVPDGTTVHGLCATLGIPPDLPLMALVNGVDTGAERRLSPGDVVSLFPPLVGGA